MSDRPSGLFSIELTFLAFHEIHCIVGSETFVLDGNFPLVSRVSFIVSGITPWAFTTDKPAEVTHGPPAFWVPIRRAQRHQIKSLGQKIFIA